MKKIYIKTYGCSFNFADSENMGGLLEQSGKYKIVNSEKEADLVIINSCTVKHGAEMKFWRDVRKIKKPKILAGCVPQAELDKNKFKGYSVVGTNQINNVVSVVDENFSGNIVQLLKKGNNPRLNIPKVRRNKVVEIVPINEGCLGKCNFCITKFARGHLKSYPIKAIVKHCRNALNDGVKELWLTSQDTACYGYDINTNIVELLRNILEMKRNFKIRLGMGNPDFLPDYLDKLIQIYKDPRMFKFLHVPVQSGSNHVLKLMKRNYKVETFYDIVERFRKEIPHITISTDIICGYPEETEEDFYETLELIEKVKPEVLNVSKFWPRPGTIAAKKKLLPTKLVKNRTKRVLELFEKNAYAKNRKWLGWTGKILIDEHGKYDGYVGRTDSYVPVIVKGNYGLGEEITVTIKRSTKHDLRGEIA